VEVEGVWDLSSTEEAYGKPQQATQRYPGLGILGRCSCRRPWLSGPRLVGGLIPAAVRGLDASCRGTVTVHSSGLFDSVLLGHCADGPGDFVQMICLQWRRQTSNDRC
jgi:hypothetical protein